MPTAPQGFFDASTVQDDWQYIDGLVTITLFLRATDAIPTTGGLVIPNCLFRAAGESLADFLDTIEKPCHIWRTQIPNGQVAFTADTRYGSPYLQVKAIGTTVPQGGGLIPGQFLAGPGIPKKTWVVSVTGNTVTMSNKATATASGVSINAAVIPKQNDVVVDPNGIRWVAQRCDIQTFATRFRLPLLQLVGG